MSEFSYVDTPSGLAAAVEAIAAAPIVGFDTEFVGEATYEPVLCLLQIATADAVFVIDPLARVDLRDFWQTLTDPSREVIALAARQELLFCLRYAGRLPGRLFDPQLAAGLVGFTYPLSHTNLVQRVLNERVGGGETYTDWRKRPLSPAQLEYAADDVSHLIAMRNALLERAESMSRVDWVLGECDRLVQRVARSEFEERWRRISGASGLSRRELAVLRELWHWRDNEARNANLPSRRILGDDLMIAIARRSPHSVNNLFALRGMDRPALRRSGADMVAAVQTGLAVPAAELPQPLGREDPPQVAILAQLAAILSNSLAAEHQVHPALLATTADLQEFIRGQLGIGNSEDPGLLEGWRGEILGLPLKDLLAGKRALRVSDIHAANPLRIEPAG